MKKKKFHMTFGLKMVLLAVGMSVALSAAALISGYIAFAMMNVSFYSEIGDTLAYTLARETSGNELDYYFELVDQTNPEQTQYTYQPDERYLEIQSVVEDLKSRSVASNVYIARAVDGVGLILLFDANYYLAEDSKGVALGSVYVSDAIDEHFRELLLGLPLASFVDSDDPDYGEVVTFAAPIDRMNTELSGYEVSGYYAMVDVPVALINRTQQVFNMVTGILLGIVALIFVIIYLLVIRFSFIKPMKRIAQAAQSCGAGAGPEAFNGLKFKRSYELQTLSDNFSNMLAKLEEHNKSQQDLAVREQALKSETNLINDLNMAVLPKRLPKREEEYPFRIQGLISRGEGLTCCFYDYFLLSGDRLCVMVGEVPGEGVPQVLFTVMAQAAIKSRLMSDLSLMETMTSANRQLYEMGGNLYLNVLVGILDGADGSFSYINAGLNAPLFMRGQGRFELLDAFSYVPLGQNENVIYRVLDLKLEQGDRLFFHSEEAGGDRDTHAGEQLCQALNETAARRADLEVQLQTLDRVSGREQASGRAMLALEYCRRDKAKAHCVLTADAVGASALQRFLREQLQANRINEQFMARFVVLGDDLFALCRQGADADSRFLAECAVRPDAVTLRIRGDMGGRDPMSGRTEGPALRAVEYIRRNSEQVSFEHDDFTDTVTLVKRI